MKQLHTEVIIEAPTEVVWKILTDFDAFPEWNPFIRSVAGVVRPGSRLTVVLHQPDGKPMTFRPTCQRFDQNKELRWLGKLWVKGVFDGEHIFELYANGDRTHFVQREVFNGILVPLFWKKLNTNTRQGFEAMNAALKERAENASQNG